MSITRFVPAVLAVLGVGIVLGGATVLPPQQPKPITSGEEVPTRVTSLCAVTDRESRTLDLTVGRAGQPTDGSLSVGNLGGDQSWDVTAGTAIADKITDGPILLRAEGVSPIPHAGGLVSRTATGAGRGLAAQACTTPGAEHWLPGLSASGDHLSTVVISNPDPDAAEVDLQFWGAKGVVEAPGSSGISIPPNGSRTVFLEGMVTEQGPITARVRATAGRVSVVADEQFRSGADARGADWMAPAAAPATTQVIPGILPGSGDRTLALVNPGDRTTTVRVEALGVDGAFGPVGADRVDLPPQSTVQLPLAAALKGEDVSLRLTADRAFTAGLVATSQAGGQAQDVARPVATAPLPTTGVATVRTDGATSTVMVANPGQQPADVTVLARAVNGDEVSNDTLSLAPGVARTFEVDTPAAFVEITSAATELHAAVGVTSTANRVAGLAWLPVTPTSAATGAGQVWHDPPLGR
ncbi:MAG: DUF5719 family protein [Propionibacteriales bacterium]|nr:DUF5719 family protein [Propionibacteriales bacterium]